MSGEAGTGYLKAEHSDETFSKQRWRKAKCVPGFPKVLARSLHFYKRPITVTIFLTEGNPKRVFAFIRKKQLLLNCESFVKRK